MPGLGAHTATAAFSSSVLQDRYLVSIVYFYGNNFKENTPAYNL